LLTRMSTPGAAFCPRPPSPRRRFPTSRRHGNKLPCPAY
jgi:hypothetical protein